MASHVIPWHPMALGRYHGVSLCGGLQSQLVDRAVVSLDGYGALAIFGVVPCWGPLGAPGDTADTCRCPEIYKKTMGKHGNSSFS